MSKKTAKKDSRKITEPLPQLLSKKDNIKQKASYMLKIVGHEFTVFSMLFLSFSLVCLLAIAGWLYLNYDRQKSEWLATRDNFLYWQEVAVKQKNSPDAYYQAAVYALELGDTQKAYGLLQKALSLDEGFEKAKQLQQLIVNGK